VANEKDVNVGAIVVVVVVVVVLIVVHALQLA
jgi:hypothetical protein